MAKEVITEHAYHKGRLCVFLRFEYDATLIALVKTMADARWSNTHKTWYISHYEGADDLIHHTLRPTGIALIQKNNPDKPLKPAPKTLKKERAVLSPLIPEQELQIKQFVYWMRSRRYGESTIDTYTDALRVFLRYYSYKTAPEITNEDLIVFNNDYILANRFSSSYQNQIINGVKLFFKSIAHKKLDPALILRPKREKHLPNVLSKEEVKSILSAPSNIKHKAMLSLIYSCGLRRGELLHLKLTDIDSKRGLITIRQAKGKKDRVVPLSEKILGLLRDYYLSYRPDIWLFEGQKKVMYSEESLAKVFKNALSKSGVIKPASLHWLRHSYATHLLDNGTDLRYIQELLGHRSSKTTEIYTHVSTKNIQNIKSPFDDL